MLITRRSALTAIAAASVQAATDVRVPVLVELFTSEGCSSCPPADRLLEALDRTQPVTDADIIVLSEHVDYWNYIGWKDPYSSAAFSRRQRQYADRFRIDSVYTPQMVVDGRSQFVGNDSDRALVEIRAAARQPKAPLELRREAARLVVASEKPFGAAAFVEVAVVRPVATTTVTRGENAGRELRHVAVATTLVNAGTVRKGSACLLPVTVAADNGMRVMAWARETATGRVMAACRLADG